MDTNDCDGVGTEMPTVAPPGNGGKSDAEPASDKTWEQFISELMVFAEDLQDYCDKLQRSGWTITNNKLVMVEPSV